MRRGASACSVQLATFALAIAVLSGCMIGPDFHGPPRTPLAASYTAVGQSDDLLSRDEQPTDALQTDPPRIEPVVDPHLAEWWAVFEDPVLHGLVQRTQSQNYTLREAAWKIAESRARLGTVRSGLFPQIDTDGTFYTQKIATNTGGSSQFGVVDTTRDLWSWGGNLSWEIDVFGRLKRLVEASEADICSDIELHRATQVLLLAEVGRNYVQARALQQQIHIVQQNIEIQQQTLQIVEARFNVGATSELDLAQARANLASTRATLPPLATQYRAALNRLSVLVGGAPGEVDALMATPAPIPTAPDHLAVGIPADLLRRRPDIRRAEHQIAAQTARIGAAMGELYPKFSITGTFGLDARDFANLFEGGSINAGVGPSFRWNILNFGRYRCNVIAQEALQQQYVLRYERVVLEAAEEVDNALTAVLHDRQRRAELTATVQSYARAAEISQRLYTSGSADFQRVLDSQRALLSYQGQLVASEEAVTGNTILLYRALGGGW